MEDNNNADQKNASLNEETIPTTIEESRTEEVSQPDHKIPKKHTKMMIILGAILVLITGLGILFLMQNSEEDTVSLQPVDMSEKVTTLGASIAATEGTVQFSSDGETWKDASGGESLSHLDYIRTLDDSRAIVLFDDGSIVRLNANTEIYLSSLQKESSEITLQTGQVYSRVVEGENSTYTVVTANERFKALGTAFTTSSSEEKDELQVYESEVEVVSQKVVVGEGNKFDTETKESSALDLDALKEDEFAQWNKEKDSEIAEFKEKLGVLADKEEEEEEPTPSTPQQPVGIVLKGTKSDKGVSLSWTVSGLSLKEGFKVVRDKSDATPSYGEHQALYVGDNKSRSTLWHDDSGGSYYYRVCIYSSGTCSNYSNAVKVDSPFIKKAEVKSGEVTLTIDGNKISWSLIGGDAPHGFKILFSEQQNPTYPDNSIKYVGSDTSSVTLPEKKAGTYYVRVCKYTNSTQESGCVDYSNQVEYVIE